MTAFTLTITRPHALRLCLVYSTIAAQRAHRWQSDVAAAIGTRGIPKTDTGIGDAVCTLRDQLNYTLIAQALAFMVELDDSCTATTDGVDEDEVLAEFDNRWLRIGEYRADEFHALLCATRPDDADATVIALHYCATGDLHYVPTTRNA
jgi:hypothetical protein